MITAYNRIGIACWAMTALLCVHYSFPRMDGPGLHRQHRVAPIPIGQAEIFRGRVSTFPWPAPDGSTSEEATGSGLGS